MSIVKRISIAFWALSDSFSSPSGQGISTDKDTNELVTQTIKQMLKIQSHHDYWNRLPLFKIFWKTCVGVSSLKGGIPVRNSNRQTPRAHQSTAEPGKINPHHYTYTNDTCKDLKTSRNWGVFKFCKFLENYEETKQVVFNIHAD